MKDIMIIQDGNNFHLKIGDTSILLSKDELKELNVGTGNFLPSMKITDCYEAGKFYYFEAENELSYIAELIEDDGEGNLRFGQRICWNDRRSDGIPEFSLPSPALVLKKKSCTPLVPADDAQMLEFTNCKDEFFKTYFKMFDKVLVRNYDDDCWFPAIYVKRGDGTKKPHKCLLIDTGASTNFQYCAPYEGNEGFAYSDSEIPVF